jgi:hypothetical protein
VIKVSVYGVNLKQWLLEIISLSTVVQLNTITLDLFHGLKKEMVMTVNSKFRTIQVIYYNSYMSVNLSNRAVLEE